MPAEHLYASCDQPILKVGSEPRRLTPSTRRPTSGVQRFLSTLRLFHLLESRPLTRLSLEAPWCPHYGTCSGKVHMIPIRSWRPCHHGCSSKHYVRQSRRLGMICGHHTRHTYRPVGTVTHEPPMEAAAKTSRIVPDKGWQMADRPL